MVCPNTFDTAFWEWPQSAGRNVSEEQCNLISLPGAVGASVYAGGTFSGSFTGAWTLTATGGNPSITAIISTNQGASGSVTTFGCNGLHGGVSASSPSLLFSGGGTSSTISLSGGSTGAIACPANGTFAGLGSLSCRINYQLVQVSGVWKAYVAAYLSCGSGQLRATKTGCVTFQMGATGISNNSYSSGGAQSFNFLGQSCSTNGTLLNNFNWPSAYGVGTFVSASLTITGSITFAASAP